jgi:type I restriction enzyme S subunit
MPSNYKRLGDYIREVKTKNTDLAAKSLLGINIDKFFMPSVANIIGTDMANYRIVKKGQFACNRMHVGRDYRIPVALSDKDEPFMVSPAYDVFEIIDKSALMPEYLMMWFTRKEFDRNAWFYTDADVRGGLPWKSFCDMQLTIPNPNKQREIVNEYNTIINSIKLNEQLNQKLEETARAIYKQWFVDFEFPDENKMPYKTNGGVMVYCEELEKDIPKGWQLLNLSSISEIKAGGDRPSNFSEIKTKNHCVPIYSNGVTNEGLYGYTDKANYPKNSITISARGTIGYCKLRTEEFDAIVRLIVLMPKLDIDTHYLYDFICRAHIDNSGSVQSQLTIPQVSSLKVIYPNANIISEYDRIITPIVTKISNINSSTGNLKKFQSILLSKLATIEN